MDYFFLPYIILSFLHSSKAPPDSSHSNSLADQKSSYNFGNRLPTFLGKISVLSLTRAYKDLDVMYKQTEFLPVAKKEPTIPYFGCQKPVQPSYSPTPSPTPLVLLPSTPRSSQ